MKSRMYSAQVKLLVQALPEVAKETCFALHGGTAINATTIQHDIARDPEWKPKLSKPNFSTPKIRAAIAELEILFGAIHE